MTFLHILRTWSRENASAAGYISEKQRCKVSLMSLAFAAGTVIDDRYQLIEQLGEGGMGTIYKARELGLERIVAVKILHQTLIGDSEHSSRFIREGKVLASLSHEHVLKIYRFGVWAGSWPYIAMEYIAGQSLTQLIRGGSVAIDRSLRIVMQVCEAMDAAHSAGVVHRDLSPNNIMMIIGEQDRAKVIDFGLCFVKPQGHSDEKLTATGMLVGSVHYMSPEQCCGLQVDLRSDIYSLGCVLYQLVTGQTPFHADNPIALTRLHSTETPAPLEQFLPCEEIPNGLSNVILRAMAKSPSSRYQSMSEFRADLELVAAGVGRQIEAPQLAKDLRRGKQSRKLTGVMVSLAVLFAGAAGYLALKKSVFQDLYTADIGDGEQRATMRRLRPASEMRHYARDKSITYYHSWLKAYGDELSMDACHARSDLARELAARSAKDPESIALRQRAISDSHKILNRALADKCGDEANLALCTIIDCRGELDQFDKLEPELRAIITRLTATENTGLLRSLNTARRQLAKMDLNGRHDPLDALVQVDAALSLDAKCSIPPDEKLELLSCRAWSLLLLKRRGEAELQINEALAYALKEVQLGESQKIDLIKIILRAGDASKALRVCEQLEPAILIRSLPERIAEYYLVRAEALGTLHRWNDAYELLNSKVMTVNAPLAMILWQDMWTFNLNGRLHRDSELISIFKSLMRSLPASSESVESVASYIRSNAENALALEQRKTAERLVWCVYAMPEFRKLSYSNLCLQCLGHIAMQMSRLGRTKEAEALVQNVITIWDGQHPGDFYTCASLYFSYADICARDKRGEESIQLCDKALRLSVDERRDARGLVLLLQQKVGSMVTLHRKEARAVAAEALALCDKYDLAPQCRVIIHSFVASFEFERGDYARSEAGLKEALKVVKTTPALGLRTGLLVSLGVTYCKENKLELAAQCLDTSIKEAPKNSNDWNNAVASYINLCRKTKNDAKLEELKQLAKSAITDREIAPGLPNR